MSEKRNIDALAYRFWSIHPKELGEWAKTAPKMPDGYKGGMRAWFFACEMRSAMSAPESGADLIEASRSLKGIVEGIDGTMNHGTWRDDRGSRLKDTTEWVRLYSAVSSDGYLLVPVDPTAAMMEAVTGDMAEQRPNYIHIFAADVWSAMVKACSPEHPPEPHQEHRRPDE